MKDIETIIKKRAEVVKKYCEEKGLDPFDLSLEQILEVRSLPDWINADEEEDEGH